MLILSTLIYYCWGKRYLCLLCNFSIIITHQM